MRRRPSLLFRHGLAVFIRQDVAWPGTGHIDQATLPALACFKDDRVAGIGVEALSPKDHPFGCKIKDDSVLAVELLHARFDSL